MEECIPLFSSSLWSHIRRHLIVVLSHYFVSFSRVFRVSPLRSIITQLLDFYDQCFGPSRYSVSPYLYLVCLVAEYACPDQIPQRGG